MKACKITVEVLANDAETAESFLNRITIMHLASSKKGCSISALDGSATLEISEIELPDVDDGENL